MLSYRFDWERLHSKVNKYNDVRGMDLNFELSDFTDVRVTGLINYLQRDLY